MKTKHICFLALAATMAWSASQALAQPATGKGPGPAAAQAKGAPGRGAQGKGPRDAGPAEPIVVPDPVDTTGAPSGPQGDTWASIKELPDLLGPWRSNDIVGRPNGPQMPLTASGQAIVKKLADIRAHGGDVEGRAKYCVTLGFPGGMTGPEEIGRAHV